MSPATHPTLSALQADYQVLYQKLRNYHWNVKGPMFFELHAKFEELYLETALHVDELAERIVALGQRPVSTLAGVLELARLSEDDSTSDPKQMVANLLSDYEALNSSLRAASKEAESGGDSATFNLIEGIADGQEKTAWMLRAYLG